MRFGTTAVLPSISWISIPTSRLFSLNSDITSGFFPQSRPLLSIPLGLSREKFWRQKLFLCLVQIEINLCALLSSTHGLICAFRGLRLGGFHPVPGTWIVREDLSLVQFELYQGTGWNPPSPWILKAQISPCVVCTKHRKSVSRQIFSRDKPSGIDNTDALVSLVTPSTDVCVMPETCTERRDKLTS